MPANTEGLVIQSCVSATAVTEGGQPLDTAEGILDVALDGAQLLVRVKSGHYSFRVN